MSVLAVFDGRPSNVARHVSVEPLVAEHRQEGRDYGSREAGVQDCLHIDHRGGWAGPLRKGENLIFRRWYCQSYK
jgi:hypothetical protein